MYMSAFNGIFAYLTVYCMTYLHIVNTTVFDRRHAVSSILGISIFADLIEPLILTQALNPRRGIAVIPL